MTKNIRVGTMDWRHPAWTGAFYPADMPQEWRLSFYASQFNCVYLKGNDWLLAAPTDLQQWCDDVHSRFIFLLEGDENSTPPESLGHKAIMSNPTDPHIVWFDRNTDLKQLVAHLKSGMADMDMFLISRDGELAQMERVGTLLELMGL
jgi:hypothetical protein